MRSLTLMVAIVVGSVNVIVGQESQPQLLTPSPLGSQTLGSQTLGSQTANPLVPYVVTLAEYRTNTPIPNTRTASEIIDSISNRSNDQEWMPLETIRISALSGTESMVQFGKRVGVTVGRVNNARTGTMRQTEFMEVGTIVRVKANPFADKIALKISFESSRLDGDPDGDTPPGIGTTEIDTTLLLELDRPTFLAGVRGDKTSLFVVTISAVQSL